MPPASTKNGVIEHGMSDDDITVDEFGFQWKATDEPHATRRKQILKEHPEVRDLFGKEPLTFPITVACVLVQLYIAFFWAPTASWWAFIVVAYAVGGTINHTLSLAGHELSHNLCFESLHLNRFLAMFSNFPMVVPASQSFRKYHMIHHQQQGVDGVDADVPCEPEVRLVTNTIAKFFWVLLNPLMYALRPFYIRQLPKCRWEIGNVVVQMAWNVVMFSHSPSTLGYCLMSSLLGLGIHPSAGHFIAEHYTFLKGQETYSYYGPVNYVNFNVGYHMEHHDFPRIPWSKLPVLKKMCPEWYDTLPCHTSYVKVLFKFILDPSMGPFSRVKRTAAKFGQPSK